jgi:hypothetical protein
MFKAAFDALDPSRPTKIFMLASSYKPISSLMITIFTLPLGKDFSVMVQVLQIRSGLLHSSQYDVFTQGVFLSNLMELAGAT